MKNLTRVTVVDADDAPAFKQASKPSAKSGFSSLDLDSAVLRIIEQDPFVSIGEIKAEINHRSTVLDTTWWEVFKLLRRNKLLTKRSRFKYILGRR